MAPYWQRFSEVPIEQKGIPGRHHWRHHQPNPPQAARHIQTKGHQRAMPNRTAPNKKAKSQGRRRGQKAKKKASGGPYLTAQPKPKGQKAKTGAKAKKQKPRPDPGKKAKEAIRARIGAAAPIIQTSQSQKKAKTSQKKAETAAGHERTGANSSQEGKKPPPAGHQSHKTRRPEIPKKCTRAPSFYRYTR